MINTYTSSHHMKSNPRVTYDNHSSASIDDYHRDFSDIWKRDADERSVFDLWLHVVDHAARVARAVRRQRPPEVIDDVADTSVWLMSFIAHCAATTKAIDQHVVFNCFPSDVIWNKYPGMCPGCFDSWILSLLDLRPGDDHQKKLAFSRENIEAALIGRANGDLAFLSCTCLTRIVTHDRDRELAMRLRTDLDRLRMWYAGLVRDRGKKIDTVVGIEDMFNAIYANVHHVLSLEIVAFHLLEEVGEATRALKDCYTYDDAREPFSSELHGARKELLLDELADVFGWLFATALKIRSTYGVHADEYRESITRRTVGDSGSRRSAIAFAEILWSKYGMTKTGANWDRLKCPGCNSAPCICGRDLKVDWNRAISPSQPEDLQMNGVSGSSTQKDLVFISYSHKDATWLDELQTMLKPLVRNQALSVWDDTKIGAGQTWKEEIEAALSRAKVAVLLVTPNFLASDFIADNELPPLLAAATSGGTQIIWIPVKPSMYTETPLADYQAAYDPSKPLISLSEADRSAALVNICNTIKKYAQGA